MDISTYNAEGEFQSTYATEGYNTKELLAALQAASADGFAVLGTGDDVEQPVSQALGFAAGGVLIWADMNDRPAEEEE